LSEIRLKARTKELDGLPSGIENRRGGNSPVFSLDVGVHFNAVGRGTAARPERESLESSDHNGAYKCESRTDSQEVDVLD
jgi:hypothetical protein